MPVEIVDLDVVVSQDREVKMGGRRYRIPGSPPMEWYLWMRQFLQRLAADGIADGALEEAYEKVLELLRLRDPKIKTIDLTAEQVFLFIARAYAEAADDGPPPRRTRGATGSRTRSNGSRSST